MIKKSIQKDYITRYITLKKLSVKQAEMHKLKQELCEPVYRVDGINLQPVFVKRWGGVGLLGVAIKREFHRPYVVCQRISPIYRI